MASRTDILAQLNEWLRPDDFQDYCPNGLQVEGRGEIRRIITGVTASQALLDQAIAAGADMVLVHHGYFWKGESQPVTGMKRRRLKTLLDCDLNLVAYHLPLDDHPEYGNNRQLGEVLDIRNARPLAGLLWQGELSDPVSPEALATLISERLGRPALHVGPTAGEGPDWIRTLAWCTGAAQGYIDKAVVAGVDAYISGEISEPTTHTARECGIHYYAAGHHATERYGVQALGKALADRFGIEHRFIDCDNPV